MPSLIRHKRSKVGRLPGDISFGHVIRMLERGETVVSYSGGYSYVIGPKACKSLKKELRSKERARLKERARTEMSEQLGV